MEKRWVVAKQDVERAKLLQQALGIHPTLCAMLVQRGIHTYGEAKSFFRPELKDLHSPFLMQDMYQAVHRLQHAIERNERILIYGDYDVDGTTSVSLMYLFLKDIYSNIDYYIPNRYTEGYGISFNGIDYAKETKCKLIIALDCGIKSNDKVDYASSLGIDFIICDHHNPGDTIPTAVAVLDPKRTDCPYPYKELSGCGIGFKLAQAFCIQQGYSLNRVYDLLDLVCTSIAADIVPITGENRILAFHGLKKLNENPSMGLKTLIELSALKKKMEISDVVFVLGPRINAAGRIDDARHAVKMLIGEIQAEADEHAETLRDLNIERQGLDKQITQEALAMIAESELLVNKKTTVLFNPGWNKGVIGIVASRLTENYYRPTIVLTESEGKVTGSARSVKHFDLYEAIYNCRMHLIQFGGHRFAAGLTMQPENVAAFTAAFEEIVSATIDPHHLVPELDIDAEVQVETLTDRFMGIINQFSPFGPGNMKPVFVLRNMRDTGYSRVVKETHIKFVVRSQSGRTMDGIGFGLAEKFALLQQGSVDIVFQLEENEWNGNKTLQMMVRDFRASKGQ
jgi:single-stranded-DNA-specific exonuclease